MARHTALVHTRRQRLLGVAAGALAVIAWGATTDRAQAQAVPTLSSISTPQASPGTVLTLTGSDLVGDASVTVVNFGAIQGSDAQCSATTCTVTVPEGGTGTVDVTVESSAGTSNAIAFTFLDELVLTSVDPLNSPSHRGGIPITFIGDGFSTAPGATTFYIDDGLGPVLRFTQPSCASQTECTALAPDWGDDAQDCLGAGPITVRVNGQTSSVDEEFTAGICGIGGGDPRDPLAETGAGTAAAASLVAVIALLVGGALLATSRRRLPT